MADRIKDMDRHDQVVYSVAIKQLKQGAEYIAIGNGVQSRFVICKNLKRKFPNRKIYTWFQSALIEFLSKKDEHEINLY